MDSEHQQLMAAVKELVLLVSEQTRALDTIAAQLLAIRAEMQSNRPAAPPVQAQAPTPKPVKESATDGKGLEIPRRQAPRI